MAASSNDVNVQCPPEKIAPRLPCGTHSLRRLRPRAIRLNRPACIPRLSDAQMGGHINAASRKSSAASGDRRLAQRYALACAASWAVASAYYVAALRSCRTLEWEYNRHSFCNCRHAKLRSPHLLTRLGRNRCPPTYQASGTPPPEISILCKGENKTPSALCNRWLAVADTANSSNDCCVRDRLSVVLEGKRYSREKGSPRRNGRAPS